MREKIAFVKPLLVLSICLLGAILLTVLWFKTPVDENRVDSQVLFDAFQGDFISSITESGEIESSSNDIIRCEVRSRGTAGTAILKIVPEGTPVSKGEFLIQFDDSILKDRLVEQQILTAQNDAARIQAENDLNAAKKIQQEYDKGTFNQELAAFESEIAVAKETKERAKEYLKFSRKLAAKGFITRSQLQADQFTVTKADLVLQLAMQKRDDLIKWTQSRMREEYGANVLKLQASLKAATSTLQLSQQREQELAEQVVKCQILAPKDGLVVYANDNDRDDSVVIEEGTVIRDGQEVIHLPDPEKMQVRTKVNDSKINLVEIGNPVEIRLDSAPDVMIQGRVREVAAFPQPRRWYQAPIEYEVFVDITEQSELVKSGLRAKAKIVVDRQQNVLQIPASSIVRRQGAYYAIVVENNRYVARFLDVGANNDKFVIIKSGLTAGERVLINPEKQRDKVDYPKS
ncbi:MAG: HlyD family efflux transporter periplasmic adaptor subunit [Pirellulaceae bacterium]|nr:HlyD family efflux transporter periplasmic adaptor subunit [Pirellulaceae bacterium]